MSVAWGRYMTCQLICRLFQQFRLFFPSEIRGRMSGSLLPVIFHNFPVYSSVCSRLCSHGRCISMYHMAASWISSVTRPSRKRDPILFSGHSQAHIQTETAAPFQTADCQTITEFHQTTDSGQDRGTFVSPTSGRQAVIHSLISWILTEQPGTAPGKGI